MAVPNTFTNGEIIDADNINQNFTEIETHVNSNLINKMLHVIDANDVDLGVLESYPGEGIPVLLSGKGYYYQLVGNANSIDVYFGSSDCSGQGYVSVEFDLTQGLGRLALRNYVYWNERDGNHYYVNRSSSFTMNPQSRYGPGGISNSFGCVTEVLSSRVVYPFILNDTSITGVPSVTTAPYDLIYK